MLDDAAVRHGFLHRDADAPPPAGIHEVSEYQGETALTIHCTQLGGSDAPQYGTPREKKRVLREWCGFLRAHPLAFEELRFCSRMPQELFGAVCAQKRLRKLHVKWAACTDISRLADLECLECLHIGSGAGIAGIAPLSQLPHLTALSLQNFRKIHDYGALAKLDRLEALYLTGNAWGPQHIRVDSLDFLKAMPQLRFFWFMTARLAGGDMTPVLQLRNAEHLTLEPNRVTKALYPQLRRLPKLRYGWLTERPELYTPES